MNPGFRPLFTFLLLATLALAAVTHAAGDKPKPYPLETCLISGEKLGGEMGKPHVIIYQGREIKFCCRGCVKDFNKDPAKYLKKLDDAEKAAEMPKVSPHATGPAPAPKL